MRVSFRIFKKCHRPLQQRKTRRRDRWKFYSPATIRRHTLGSLFPPPSECHYAQTDQQKALQSNRLALAACVFIYGRSKPYAADSQTFNDRCFDRPICSITHERPEFPFHRRTKHCAAEPKTFTCGRTSRQASKAWFPLGSRVLYVGIIITWHWLHVFSIKKHILF